MRRSVRHWLLLGVTALALAGIFAGMLANTKSAYFFTALVAHVDLSVMVWFLAFACMLMNMVVPWGKLTVLGTAAFMSLCIATVCIALAAFSGGTPYQNNYIPVIHHRIFFMGLGVLFCGVMCAIVQFMVSHNIATNPSPARIGVMSVAALLLMSAFAFLWSYRSMPAGQETGQAYFEQLFWGGGHILQIAYAQMMVVAWFWLAEAAGVKMPHGRKLALLAYAAGLLCGLGGVALSLAHAPGTAKHVDTFTMLMRHGNGLPSFIAAVALLPGLVAARKNSLAVICLLSSGVLYGVGGSLGFLIQGSNVIVPAHYHGSIVGVTLALMGIAYLLMPQLGYASMESSKIAKLQPVLYGGGQLFWMAGMAIGGAYGMARKTPGSADLMGGMAGFLKHGGDGLSLIGGLLFVYVVLKSGVEKRNLNVIP